MSCPTPLKIDRAFFAQQRFSESASQTLLSTSVLFLFGMDGYDAAWFGSDPHVVKTHRALPGEYYLTRKFVSSSVSSLPSSAIISKLVLMLGLRSRPEPNGRFGFPKSGPNPSGRCHVDNICSIAVQRYFCNADDSLSVNGHVDESIALKQSSFIVFGLESFRLSVSVSAPR